MKQFQQTHKRLFIKPIPGEATSNTFNTENEPIQKNNYNHYVKDLLRHEYNKMVVQRFMPQFATNRYPEIRTFWVGDKFQYGIHTTSVGYYQKSVFRIPAKIKKDTLKIIKFIETKFKFKFIFARFDWGYDKIHGYFLNEIELFPGMFSEYLNDNKGNCKWTVDEKIGDRLVKVLHA